MICGVYVYLASPVLKSTLGYCVGDVAWPLSKWIAYCDLCDWKDAQWRKFCVLGNFKDHSTVPAYDWLSFDECRLLRLDPYQEIYFGLPEIINSSLSRHVPDKFLDYVQSEFFFWYFCKNKR